MRSHKKQALEPDFNKSKAAHIGQNLCLFTKQSFPWPQEEPRKVEYHQNGNGIKTPPQVRVFLNATRALELSMQT
ncbi:hypothetical protein A9Q88_05535 [Gammaproteobacteria bacterium 50_400_T64]|nr:hypothetical protein A9Q88_05535 [Gammaproteobacteria bacterium 50_400_T64]